MDSGSGRRSVGGMRIHAATSRPLSLGLAGLALLALGACAPKPEDVARVKAEQEAFYQRTFLPGAPKPGDLAYDPNACGGDHGMAEQWYDDLRGAPRLGPPEMSICR